MFDRKFLQDAYIRVCKDSGWQIDGIEAAKLTAKVIGCHPYQIWTAFGYLDTMLEVSKGDHPICKG
jgi:hypothetical protein